jgi:hypothetical protein
MSEPNYGEWAADSRELVKQFGEVTHFFREGGPIPRRRGMHAFLDKLLRAGAYIPNLVFDLPKDAKEPERVRQSGDHRSKGRMEHRGEIVRDSATRLTEVLAAAEAMPLPDFEGREVFMAKLKLVAASTATLEAKMAQFLPVGVRKRRGSVRVRIN